MAVVFKRLPAVTFCGMLIRPQSTAGRVEVHWEIQQSLSHFSPFLPLYSCLILALSYLVAATTTALRQRSFKINILLHMLLISTNLNLYNSQLPFPSPTPFLSFPPASHFPQEINVPKITLTHCQQSRQTQGSSEWLGSALKMSWN